MKTRIAVGAGLLLTLGTAAAGTFIFGQSSTQTPRSVELAPGAVTSERVTPQMIAMWKATASSSDYVAPKVPI
jgi:hypothetical protein